MAKTKAAKYPRPNRTGSNVNVWISQALRARLDAYLADTVPRVPLTNVVEVALALFLDSKGVPPLPK